MRLQVLDEQPERALVIFTIYPKIVLIILRCEIAYTEVLFKVN